MLAPVSDHEAESKQAERDEQDECRSARVDVRGHEVQESVGSVLGSGGLEGQFVVLLAREVEWQVEPDEEQKAADVVREVPDIVSLIAQRGRKIVWPVAFDVMVLDVVVVIRVPSVAHQRFQDVREAEVEESPVFGEYAAVVDVVVHQECERACAPECEGRVDDSVDVGEVVEEIHRAGEIDECIQEDVR